MARIPALKIVIAYEDFAVALRAREMAGRLVTQLNPGIGITHQVWRFDLLRNAELKEAAVQDAVAADMIILSAHGTAPLPAHVTAWIESWLPQKRNRPAAFVALLDQVEELPGDSSSPCHSLRQIAEAAGMDFFLKAGGWTQPALPGRLGIIRRETEPNFAVMEEGLHEDYPAPRGWGIND